MKVRETEEFDSQIIAPEIIFRKEYSSQELDFDNPDIKSIRDTVLDDFSYKVLQYFKEYPYDIAKSPCPYIHEYINNRWNKRGWILNEGRYPKITRISYITDNKIAEHCLHYFKDYFEHNYVGKNINYPKNIKDMKYLVLGGAEMPFIDIYLLGGIPVCGSLLCYKIVR